MLAEVANVSVTGEELPGRLGDDDLSAMRGGRDSRGPVDVDPDVALVRRLWLTGVNSDTHADRAALERVARVGGRRNCVRCASEGDEEGVALGVDLDACVRGERLSQDASVLGEEVGVPVSVLLKEPRRALDVREEERDGADGKLAITRHDYCPSRRSHSARNGSAIRYSPLASRATSSSFTSASSARCTLDGPGRP